jgi:Heterokaryon incompatibility protein (HET)
MARYVYGKLLNRQIRVLWLFAGRVSDQLRGKLEVASIDRFAQYANLARQGPVGAVGNQRDWFEALSYCWGSSEMPFSLDTPTGTIPITASLNSALSRLRSSDGDRPLWADAVCINQEDAQEKEHQVPLMGEIYSCARKVLVDLGDATPGSSEALEMMDLYWRHNIVHGIAISGQKLNFVESLQFLGMDVPESTQKTLPPPDNPQWDCVRGFLRRPWFHRVWIIQEFILAREVVVMCGNDFVDWRILWAMSQSFNNWEIPFAFADQRESHAGLLAIGRLGMSRRLRELPTNPEAMTMTALLERFGSQKVTLARDRFFGLLGIAEDGARAAFVPDYTAPFESIVRRVGKDLLLQGGADMLMRAGMSTAPDRFPSWTVDWSRGNRIPIGLNTTVQDFRATLDTEFLIVPDSAVDDQVETMGKEVDTVLHVEDASAIQEHDSSVEDGLSFITLCAKLFLTSETYLNGEPAMEACWRTSIAGLLAFGKQSYRAGFQALHLSKTTGMPLSEAASIVGLDFGQLDNDVMDEARSYIRAVGVALDLYRLFPARTHKGYIGLLPPSSQPGDQIWLIRGCRVPMVLRPSPERPVLHRLVGSCYVHGIMNGEFLLEEGFTFTPVGLL